MAYTRGLLSTPQPPTSAEPIRSLVVLPFENLTGDRAQDYFADSVTDAVTAHLAQVDGVDVISRTSARQYKQTIKRLPQIRTELNNVEGVVEGTVQRSGETVRITVKLIRAATDRTLGAYIRRRHEQDVQPAAADRVRPRGGVGGPGPARCVRRRSTRRRTRHTSTASTRGVCSDTKDSAGQWDISRKRSPSSPTLLKRTPSWRWCRCNSSTAVPTRRTRSFRRRKRRRARRCSSMTILPKAHRALGQILNLYYWRWEEGDKALERATAIGGLDDPPEAISDSLIRRGRFQEAIAAAERGRKLDPLSVSAQVTVGNACRAAGEYDRAISELRRALEMSPANNRVQFQMGVTLVAMGRPADAIRELEIAARQAHGSQFQDRGLPGLRLRCGRTRARGARGAEGARGPQAGSVRLLVRHRLDSRRARREERLPWLPCSAHSRTTRWNWDKLNQYPPFKTIASEPAFQAIMRQVGR